MGFSRLEPRDGSGRGIDNLLDVILQALGPDHRKDADFRIGANTPQELCASEARPTHCNNIVHDSDFLWHEEGSICPDTVHVNRNQRTFRSR